MNSRVKTLWGAKPHVYLGNVAPGVAEVGSLFPARARLKFKSFKKWHAWSARGRSATQNVRQTAARARLCKEKREKFACSQHLRQIRLAKCARDETVVRARFHAKNEKIEAIELAWSCPHC